MKKFALALAATSLSTATLAGPLDYNHATATLDINSSESVDSEQVIGAEGNMRLDGGLFFGGATSYFLVENNDGSGNDHYTVAGEAGYALSLGDNQELAAAVGVFYADFTDANTDLTDYTTRIQYTYSCDNGRHYEAEYSYNFAEDDARIDTDALRLSVEGGDRNSWRYDVGFTRQIENEANAVDVSFILPLTPQDQGEIVLGMEYSEADNSDVEGHNFTVGYRWNLD